jgi:hypothetical protein
MSNRSEGYNDFTIIFYIKELFLKVLLHRSAIYTTAFHKKALFFCITIYLSLFGFAVSAQAGDISDSSSSYKRGTELFLSGKSSEAIPLLTEITENGTALSPAELEAFNYLGLALHQTGAYAEALEAFARGLAAEGTDKKVLSFNSGNAAYMLGDYIAAEGFYSQVLASDPAHAGALLNRANAMLMMNRLAEASMDYTRYLEIDTASPQHETIQTVQSLIEAELRAQDAEQQRRAQESLDLAAEQQRIDAESARSAEEALIHAQWLESGQISSEAAAEAGRLTAESSRAAAELRAAENTLLEQQQRASRLESPERALQEDAEAAVLYEEYLSAFEALRMHSELLDVEAAANSVSRDGAQSAEQSLEREREVRDAIASYAEERFRLEREEADKLQRLLDSIDAATLEAAMVAISGQTQEGTELDLEQQELEQLHAQEAEALRIRSELLDAEAAENSVSGDTAPKQTDEELRIEGDRLQRILDSVDAATIKALLDAVSPGKEKTADEGAIK